MMFVSGLLSSCLTLNLSHAQAPAEASVQEALLSLQTRAAVVFRGQVARVEPRGDVVQITFAVDEWLKAEWLKAEWLKAEWLNGPGTAFTLREWSGLWLSDPRRWLPGQAAVVFLRPAGASGLASPVDGMDGVLPVVGFTGTPGSDTVPAASVERLRARVRRAVGTALPGAGEPLTMASLRTLLAGGDGAKAPGLQPVLTSAPASLPAGIAPQQEDRLALAAQSRGGHAVQ